MSFFITDAHAQSGGGFGGGGLDILLLIIPMFLIMYFLVIRPQNKRQREYREMIEGLAKGDKILTQGGMIGTITKIYDDGKMDVDMGNDVKLHFVKEAVSSVVEKKNKPAAAEKS